MKIKANYTVPKLCNRKNDLKKDWFVYFYYTNPQNGVKKIFRYKLGINYLKTKKEREAEAKAIEHSLLEKLEKGWNPFTNEIKTSSERLTIVEALEMTLELKKNTLTESSKRTYTNIFNFFKAYLVKRGLDNLYIYNFTLSIARSYFDYLLTERKHVGFTYNTHLRVIGSLFSSLEERGVISVNPCRKIKTIAVEKGKNTTYSSIEEEKFIKYARAPKYSGFLLATRFVKYCFFRRSELRGLQVKHINWENKTIVIPSENAKSRIQDSVTIPKTLEKFISDSGVLNYSPETYLFSKKYSPGRIKINNDGRFTYGQRIINKHLKIKSECSFYSWKHTGVVELYKLTKDPYTVMRQCRHSDIRVTMTYLRALGCGVNEHVREW